MLIAHWIDNQSSDRPTERRGDIFDPARGEKTGEVAFASSADVDHAVQSAKRASVTWRESSLSQRSKILFQFRALVDGHKEELATLIAREHGKVLSDALGEVQRGLDVMDFACGIPQLIKGEFSESVSTDVDSYSLRQPLGVVVGITPFNFPVMVPMWMYPIAIACGNTFILKPSEKDPSASVLAARLFAEAGLPPGVFNVLHGDKIAVDRLIEHPDVAAVSFVGSTPVARAVYQAATKQGKRAQALGGAKNHMVVLPDADMERAADAAVSAAYGSAGERCMAISVLVTVGAAADKLLPQVQERIRGLKVGPGLDPTSEMGPLVTRAHWERVSSLVAQGVAEGAALIEDGRARAPAGPGFFLAPCLFDQVTPEMTIYKEEIFGPVLSVVRVPSYEEAVALVNRCPYANGVAIFTNDGGAARRFQHEIEVGMVGINVPIPVPMAYYSFGGWKSSLFGDHNLHGREGVAFYTRAKVVSTRWAPPQARGVDLGFPTHK